MSQLPNTRRVAVLQANSWARKRKIECHPMVSYKGYYKSARRHGWPHRTTNGMAYHLPHEKAVLENEAAWVFRARATGTLSVVLFYFGESIADLEESIAYLFMVYKDRPNHILLSCKGDRDEIVGPFAR